MDSNDASTRGPGSNPLESLADRQGFLVIPGETVDDDAAENEAYQIKIPGYTILERIGRGGTSIVYRACDVDHPEQQFAVKIFLESVLNRASLVRFNRETQSLAKLQHPSIAKLHDYGIGEDSHPFLVMELIEGQRIDRYCEEKERTVAERVELFIKVCHAVQHAHEKGVLHRDLKPANILIGLDGAPHLTDFGLAKFLGSDTPTVDKTRTGAVLGTLNYLAPEQVFNLEAKASPATDVFGLGAVLHTVLTGKPPMKFGSFVDAAREYFNKLPVDIDGKYNVPASLEAICIKCLAPDQSLRYQTVDELTNELQSYLDGNSVTAKTQKYLRKFSLLRRQYPWLIRATCGVLVLSVVMAVLFFSLWRSSVNALDREELTTKELKSLSLDLGEVAGKIRFNHGSPETLQERSELLEAFSGLYTELIQRFPDDPNLLFAAAENHYKLARMKHHLGIREAQFKSYENAKHVYEQLIQADPDHEEGRFGYFHLLMSICEYRRALEVIESLNQDFPDSKIYQSCTCSANLAIAQQAANHQEFEQALPFLSAGNQILLDADESAKSKTWYIDKSIQSNLLLTRLALVDGKLADAQESINTAIKFCESRDPLGSGVVSYSVWYLQSLDLAFGVAAYRQDHQLAKSLSSKADEFYPRAQQRYKNFIELYEYRCRSLENRAAYCFLMDDQIGLQSVEQQWQTTIQQWDTNSEHRTLDFLVASTKYAARPFQAQIDRKVVLDGLVQLERELGDSPRYSYLRGTTNFRIGDLDLAKQLFEFELESGHHVPSEAYLQVIQAIEAGTKPEEVQLPSIKDQAKLTLFAIRQSYIDSQLDHQLSYDLRTYQSSRQ